jgi:GxxExxY protein
MQPALSSEGYALMGAAFEVHREIGGGLAEEVYQECLEFELSLREIPFISKSPIKVSYKGRQLRKEYIPDLLVENAIIVELKAVAKLLPEHDAQILNYMRIAGAPVGYLINFAPLDRLEWKRLVL